MQDAIKTMQLYTAVDRIHADLAAEGFGRDDALPVDVVNRYDQLHYFGTDAVDEAIGHCGLAAGARVLDIGSGFGGPARYLAHRADVAIDAVEIQADMNATAADLTSRCGLAEKVRHVKGDILQVPLPRQGYDAAVSWLALYHIPARAPLFPRLAAALRQGGHLYVEDLYCRSPLSEAEEADMAGMLYSNTLPQQAEYEAELATAGFSDIVFTDMTAPWAAFTRDRLAAFRQNREAFSARHGSETFEALDAFYATIAALLGTGNVGGVRLTARRP